MLRDIGNFLFRYVEVSRHCVDVDTHVVFDLCMCPKNVGGVVEETELFEQMG
jgi:hypothetical protein